MKRHCLPLSVIGGLFLLTQFLVAADPVEPANDPLPDGAKARFGITRPILRNNPGVGLVFPAGVNLLAPTTTGGARRYDVGTGRPLEKRGLIDGGQVVVSADGKRAAIARPGFLTVVDVATGEQLFAAKPNEGVVIAGIPGVSLSADGTVLAFGGRGADSKGWIVVCNVNKNEVLAQFETLHAYPVYPTLSRDGATVISHGPPAAPPRLPKIDAPAPVVPAPKPESVRTAQVWEAASGKELCQVRLTGMGGSIVTAAFSPAGRLVAVAAGDGPIDLWDVRNGKRISTLLGRVGQGVKVAIAPDGKTIASVGPDYRIQRWTIDGKPLEITDPPSGLMVAPITGLQFADNERVIAWMTVQQFAVAWEAPSGKLLTPATPHIARLRSISFANGEKDLFTSGQDGHVIRWEQPTGLQTETITLRPARLPGQPLIRPIVNLSGDATRAVWPRTPIEVFDLATGSDVFSIPSPSTPPGYVNIVLSADGSKVVTVSRQAPRDRAWSCVVWDLATERRIAEFDVPAPPATANALGALVSPRHERLMFAYTTLNANRATILVIQGYDLKSGKKLAEVEDANVSGTLCMVVVDETTVVLSSTSGRLWQVDYAAGRLGEDIDTLPVRPDVGGCHVDISADRKRLAVSIPGEQPETYSVRLYDWPAKKALHTFTGHLGPVTTLQFSPDSKFLASGAEDTSVLLWDLDKIPRK